MSDASSVIDMSKGTDHTAMALLGQRATELGPLLSIVYRLVMMEGNVPFRIFSSRARKPLPNAETAAQPSEEPCTRTSRSAECIIIEEEVIPKLTRGPDSGANDRPADLEVQPLSGFRSLGLGELLDKTCRSLGIKRPTAVQKACIPAILKGRDVIGTAHTGSGKTAAFALPILQKLAEDPFGIFALVLTPTRELAFQLAEQFRALGSTMSLQRQAPNMRLNLPWNRTALWKQHEASYANLQDAVVIGGLDMQTQAKALAQRPHVVVGTPGRLRDLLQNEPDLASCFANIKFLVLDEADRLLEPTFESELRVIGTKLPARRQTLLFSATMTKSLIAMQAAALQDAFCFQAYEGLTTAHKLKEEYIFIPAKVKEVYLFHLLSQLEQLSVRSAIVFVSTCSGCHLLGLMLEELSIDAVALHSQLPQRRRLAALDRFKSGASNILLATDVASRGLDIPSVDLVVNFDLPLLARDYVHRVGRTARAMQQGWALSFVSQYDVELIQKIEKLLDHKLESYEMKEKDVLKGITKVYTARRAAAMRKAGEASLQESKNRVPMRVQKRQKLHS